MSQHLVFANCIPLVIKFFNQTILAYVQTSPSVYSARKKNCQPKLWYVETVAAHLLGDVLCNRCSVIQRRLSFFILGI